jgi:hypothetical protein
MISEYWFTQSDILGMKILGGFMALLIIYGCVKRLVAGRW